MIMDSAEKCEGCFLVTYKGWVDDSDDRFYCEDCWQDYGSPLRSFDCAICQEAKLCYDFSASQLAKSRANRKCKACLNLSAVAKEKLISKRKHVIPHRSACDFDYIYDKRQKRNMSAQKWDGFWWNFKPAMQDQHILPIIYRFLSGYDYSSLIYHPHGNSHQQERARRESERKKRVKERRKKYEDKVRPYENLRKKCESAVLTAERAAGTSRFCRDICRCRSRCKRKPRFYGYCRDHEAAEPCTRARGQRSSQRRGWGYVLDHQRKVGMKD